MNHIENIKNILNVSQEQIDIDKVLIYCKENLLKFPHATLGRLIFLHENFSLKIATDNIGVLLNNEEQKIESDLTLKITSNSSFVQFYEPIVYFNSVEDLNIFLQRKLKCLDIYSFIKSNLNYYEFIKKHNLILEDMTHFSNIAYQNDKIVFINYGLTEELDEEVGMNVMFDNNNSQPQTNNTFKDVSGSFELYEEE